LAFVAEADRLQQGARRRLAWSFCDRDAVVFQVHEKVLGIQLQDNRLKTFEAIIVSG